MIKVNLNDPIPRFVLTRLQHEDGARYFGPFAHSASAKRTLDVARKQFHLRGCRVLNPVDTDYKHCLYAHLRHCTAPCIGNVTREQYLEQVRAACDFMAGQAEEIEKEIESEMKKAAADQDFEKAAQLRDILLDLRQTTQKTHKFARVPYTLPVAIDPARDVAELGKALGLPALPARIEGFDISNISGTFVVASMVSFFEGKPDRSHYRRFRMKGVTGQDDFASMAETIRRRYSRLLKEIESAPAESESREAIKLPDLIVIDGGKGQLGMAFAELTQLGLAHLPMIGLAKEFEEIYRPGQSETPAFAGRFSGSKTAAKGS